MPMARNPGGKCKRAAQLLESYYERLVEIDDFIAVGEGKKSQVVASSYHLATVKLEEKIYCLQARSVASQWVSAVSTQCPSASNSAFLSHPHCIHAIREEKSSFSPTSFVTGHSQS